MIRTEGLEKVYQGGGQRVNAVRGIDLSIPAGQFVSVMGASGSGKSTLLHLLGALDKPSAGEVFLMDQPLSPMGDEQLARLRRTAIGFIFQFFNLMPTLTAMENVMLPALLEGKYPRELETRAGDLLGRVGLGQRLHHLPGELSGGEMQRVAIARALVNAPGILLADEPTGNLDSHSGQQVLALLREVATETGAAVVMVTHDKHAAAVGDRLLTLQDGRIVDDARVP